VRDAAAPLIAVNAPAFVNASRSVMAARLHRREQIARTRHDFVDALAYVRWLLPAAAKGDTEAQFAIAEEIQNCYWWEHSERRGKTWRQLLLDPTWQPKRRDQIQRQLIRCEALNAAPEEQIGAYGQWMERAVAGGDGRALLMQAGITDDRTEADQIADFHKAVATGDPDVLRSIVVSYAYTSDGYSWHAHPPSDLLQQMKMLNATLDLADCQLGTNCSLQDRQADCADEWAAFDCTYASDLKNYYEVHLAAEDFARVSERAQILVKSFLSGTYDWPEAKAYEEMLGSPTEESTGEPPKKGT